MREVDLACPKFVRKSAVLTNAVPLYIKRDNVIIYAADKVIYAYSCDTDELLYKVSVHSDLITHLWLESTKLFSCGLDGKVVVSDIDDGHTLSWSSSYTLPIGEKSAAKPYKSMTCVACHPTETIVATGNAMGEIMIWWNLTTTSSDLFGKMHAEGEEDDDDDNSGEGEPAVGHFRAINKNCNSAWRLLHPKHVRRSGMHWHNSNVTALAFSSEGKHLYSGGVEGVLVKWDLTDCFGGIENRRFLSMLNSPIKEISSPGGDSGDCAVVLLERNCFFVVNGAMQIIYKRMGLDQTPWRWRAFTAPQPGPPTALVLPYAKVSSGHGDSSQNNDGDTSASLLLSGALGGLQVVDTASAKVLSSISAKAMDVNQRHYVVCDGVPSPLVSEVLLVEAWHNGDWVATYAELQLPRLLVPRPNLAGHSSDNQAQLLWWRRVHRRDQGSSSSG
eukprot:TsM_000566200 transcript=TsM_000566200 gene=TsM_000566200